MCCKNFGIFCIGISFPSAIWVWNFQFDCTLSVPSFPTFYTNVEHQTSNHAILELSRQILANVAVMSSVILVCMREQKVRTNAMIRESEMFIMFCPKLLS